MSHFSLSQVLAVMGLVLLLADVGCAGKPGAYRRPPGSREPPVTERSEGPERGASDALIERGVILLDQEQVERAGDAFRESISVDPSNGAGYYWLARVKSRLGEYREASNLLDRAQTLLAGEDEWEEKIESLRQEIEFSRY